MKIMTEAAAKTITMTMTTTMRIGAQRGGFGLL